MSHPPQPPGANAAFDYSGYPPPGPNYGVTAPPPAPGTYQAGYPAPGPGAPYGQYPPGAPQSGRPQQPVAWMQRPTVPGCPQGLEYLTLVDQLLVHQQIEVFELMTGYETANKYAVKNSLGQQVYFCKEESDFCVRNACGSQRPFVIHVMDNTNIEVLTIDRPYKYMCLYQCISCCDCCQDEVEVRASNGETMGYVKQVLKGCNVTYQVRDAVKQTVLTIHGPSYCYCKCFGQDINFKVMTADGSTEVGRITKQWTGLVQEYFTDADNFGVQFPMDLDVKIKAVLLGAVFLIDFMFFEDNQANSRNNY